MLHTYSPEQSGEVGLTRLIVSRSAPLAAPRRQNIR